MKIFYVVFVCAVIFVFIQMNAGQKTRSAQVESLWDSNSSQIAREIIRDGNGTIRSVRYAITAKEDCKVKLTSYNIFGTDRWKDERIVAFKAWTLAKGQTILYPQDELGSKMIFEEEGTYNSNGAILPLHGARMEKFPAGT